jgi:hypothetical protein
VRRAPCSLRRAHRPQCGTSPSLVRTDIGVS